MAAVNSNYFPRARQAQESIPKPTHIYNPQHISPDHFRRLAKVPGIRRLLSILVHTQTQADGSIGYSIDGLRLLNILRETDLLLTPDEVARFLRVSTRTLENWRREKRGPSYLAYADGEHHTIRYDVHTLIAWVDACQIAHDLPARNNGHGA